MLATQRLRALLNHLTRQTAPITRNPASLQSPSSPQTASSIRQMSTTNDETPRFPLSEVPKTDGIVRSAGMLIIGDEILNGQFSTSLKHRI